MRTTLATTALSVALGICFSTGCVSVNQLALNTVGDALSGSGSGTAFTGDNDPALVADALPFAVKMYEALLEANPTHAGLARAAAQVEVTYATAFLAGEADLWPTERFDDKQVAWARAKNLDLRGRDHAVQALDLRAPGFRAAFETGNTEALARLLPRFARPDAAALYWFAAGHLSALALTPADLDLSARTRFVLACAERGRALDPGYGGTSFDGLLASAWLSLPAEMGGDRPRGLEAAQRALTASGGRATSVELTLATAVDLPAQDRASFQARLKRILQVDAQGDPQTTLAVLLDQRRARWYLDRVDDLFLE